METLEQMADLETIDQNTKLVKIESDHANNKYPQYLRNVREANPDCSFNENPDVDFIGMLGYAKVYDTTKPEGDVVEEGTPIFENGYWMQTWTIRGFTDEEKSVELTRRKTMALASIAEKANAALEQGFMFNFGTDYGHVQLRSTDRAFISNAGLKADRLIAKGVEDPVCVFRVLENVTYRITPQKMRDLSEEAYEAHLQVQSVVWNLKDAVEAATNIGDLPVIPEQIDIVSNS